MTGWHYTTRDHWDQIRVEGLRLYPINKEAVGTIQGIWIWDQPLNGRAHLGSVMYQLAMKSNTRVVLLEVDYDPATTLHREGEQVILHHHGEIGNWQYHTGETTAVIGTEPIPPDRIRKTAEWDLVDWIGGHVRLLLAAALPYVAGAAGYPSYDPAAKSLTDQIRAVLD